MSKTPRQEEREADYFDYEDNTPPEDYVCPYCGSPSPEVHTAQCPVNDYGD